MPVVGEAGNRITWNHFFVEGGTGLLACRFDPRHTLHHQAPFDKTASHISNPRRQAGRPVPRRPHRHKPSMWKTEFRSQNEGARFARILNSSTSEALPQARKPAAHSDF